MVQSLSKSNYFDRRNIDLDKDSFYQSELFNRSDSIPINIESQMNLAI